MPTISMRNWRVRSSSGMTLTELLVAMMILLVGIYAVVTGFPSLFRNIEGERVRTEMARLCENTIERLKTSPEMVPEAIVGHDPVAPYGVINPYSERDDALSVQPGNAHDDYRWVMGMTIRAPAADVGQNVAVYPLALGPASSDLVGGVWAMQGAARELVSLERLNQAPAGTPPAGTFYLDSDGLLSVPSGYDAGMVDYCWVSVDGTTHYVWDEYVAAGGTVRAASVINAQPSDFANVVPSACAARGAIEHYPIYCGTAVDVVATNEIVLEQTYGALLLLPRTMAGATLQIDYALKSQDDSNGNPRRTPVVMQEVPAPTVEPYQVDLKFRNLDDENSLYTTDMTGVALSDVYVLIVDTQNGRQWTNNDAFVTLDMINGTVTLDWTNLSSPMTADQARGHELRIYYRTLDGHNVELMRAPRFFVEDLVAATYHAAGQTDAVDYREFSASSASVGAPPAMITTLTLPASMAGMAVSVDYLHGASAPYARVCNEVHVVDVTTFTVVLNGPDVQAIVAVQGLTLKARGWWETQTGRVEKLDVDTFLTPESLL